MRAFLLLILLFYFVQVNVSEELEKTIINGRPVPAGKYPFFTLLHWFKKDKFGNPVRLRCGGVLISKEYVLTAAHCIGTDMEVMIKRVF